MSIKRYKIKHVSDPANGCADLWQIDIEIHPNFFERIFMGNVFPYHCTLIGSYLNWHWAKSNKKCNILWSMWADCAVKKHKSDHGTAYIYRSTD